MKKVQRQSKVDTKKGFLKRDPSTVIGVLVWRLNCRRLLVKAKKFMVMKIRSFKQALFKYEAQLH